MISFRVMTKELGNSEVGVARMTMSRPLRTSSATGRVPVCANSQSPRMTPAAACGPPTAIAGKVMSIPSLLEETGFGSEPGSALPCRK